MTYKRSIYNFLKFNYLNFRLIFLRSLKYKFKQSILKDFNLDNTERRIIVMQTPEHGNLGDQAIAYAQEVFIRENFIDYNYFEVSFDDVVKKTSFIKKHITQNDIIFIHGGGNMGDMYLMEELTRRYIIKSFKGNKIISFPQTISFSKSLIGKLQLQKTLKIYQKNAKDLVVIGRESKSFDFMKKTLINNKILYTPDIVLSLSKTSNKKREGILTCFRNDEEINVDKKTRKDLISLLKKEFKKVETTDTVVKRKITIDSRSLELKDIWNKFQTAEVVITDRLHGMIFCAITATPCIVFKNANHKIQASYYDWLKDIEYIKFIDEADSVDNDKIIKNVWKLKQIDNSVLQPFDSKGNFQEIIDNVNGKEKLVYEQL